MRYLILLLSLATHTLGMQVKTWTMHELSRAVESKLKTVESEDKGSFPEFDETTQPLVDALNEIMYALFNGKNKDVTALMKSPTGGTLWTVDQLKEAMSNPETNPDLAPFVSQAFQQLVNINSAGKHITTTEVEVPALDISVWTRSEIRAALNNAQTNPKLLPYLREALDKMNNDETASLITPVGLIPSTSLSPTIVPRPDLV